MVLVSRTWPPDRARGHLDNVATLFKPDFIYFIKNKEWIVAKSAFDEFNKIVSLIAGDQEKLRKNGYHTVRAHYMVPAVVVGPLCGTRLLEQKGYEAEFELFQTNQVWEF